MIFIRVESSIGPASFCLRVSIPSVLVDSTTCLFCVNATGCSQIKKIKSIYLVIITLRCLYLNSEPILHLLGSIFISSLNTFTTLQLKLKPILQKDRILKLSELIFVWNIRPNQWRTEWFGVVFYNSSLWSVGVTHTIVFWTFCVKYVDLQHKKRPVKASLFLLP